MTKNGIKWSNRRIETKKREKNEVKKNNPKKVDMWERSPLG
jgi:hypothetical protein